MRALEDIIDYRSAPLVQWEPVVGDSPSLGKQHEDQLTHSAILEYLKKVGAQNITGIIADEARLELTVAKQIPGSTLTHLTLRGAFEDAAQHNVSNSPSAVRVTSNIDDVAPHSQDAVVMNMIVGCLARPENHRNIGCILTMARSLLKDNGSLIVVRPNPEGGEFSTYSCLTPRQELSGGNSYQFIVKGLEEFGAMENLFTPDDFLADAMKKAGFSLGKTEEILDTEFPNQKAPFLLNACKPIVQ